MIAAIKYGISPTPAQRKVKINPILTIVGSMPKYSPSPPHTPAIFLLSLLLNNLFAIGLIAIG